MLDAESGNMGDSECQLIVKGRIQWCGDEVKGPYILALPPETAPLQFWLPTTKWVLGFSQLWLISRPARSVPLQIYFKKKELYKYKGTSQREVKREK